MSQDASAASPALDPNDNVAYLVYIPAAVFVVICPVLMGLRVWARLKNGGKLGYDDWTAMAALVSCLHDWPFGLLTGWTLGIYSFDKRLSRSL